MIVHVASEIQFFCLFFLIIQLRAHTLRQEEQTIKYYLAFHCFSICTDNGVFSTLLYKFQIHFRTCHGSFFAGNVVEQRKHKTRQRTQAFVENEFGKTHNKLMLQAKELRSPYRMIVRDIIQQLTLRTKVGRSPYRMIVQDIIQQLTLRTKVGRSPYRMIVQDIIQQLTLRTKAGRSPYRMIIRDIIQQRMLWAKAGRSPYRMIIRDIIQQLTLRTKAGRSPNWNIAQGNTLGGRSLAHWRAVSAKGASEVSFSQFPFALTARQYVGIYLPRVLPWEGTEKVTIFKLQSLFLIFYSCPRSIYLLRVKCFGGQL